MRAERFNDYLREHKLHVFSIYDAAKLISKRRAYASKFLASDRYIKRAERGLYYTMDASEYEVASRIAFPSYISLVSALRFYNLTEQIPHIIFVMAAVQHRPMHNLGGFEVKFKKLKRELFYGYGKADGAMIADPEKAVIDMIYLNEFVEYAEEAVEERNLDIAKLRDYALRTGSGGIARKVEAMIDAREK